MLTAKNIGPGSQHFHKGFPNWTQMIVVNEHDQIVAQFFGPDAKRLAWTFVSANNRRQS